MSIEIQKKPQNNYLKDIKVTKAEDIFNLTEVQEIKNAIQEHLLFIGLDRSNNIRSINLLGIGTSSGIFINNKDILMTALLTASEKVILVHNHPSNTLKASAEDKHLTNVTNKFLNIFNIQLLDHIIVAENGYLSMEKGKEINRNYENDNIKFIENTLIIEENARLKKELEKFNFQTQNDIPESEDEIEF